MDESGVGGSGWTWVFVLLLVGGYLIIETVGSIGTLVAIEGFVGSVGIGSRILMEDDVREPKGTVRDLRFAAGNVDLAGVGAAVDFCRAIKDEKGDSSLMVVCERADGGVPLQSHSVRDGFRMSRDDYWTERGDYCRILKDEGTGEWSSQCLVPNKRLDGFKEAEMIDADPPPRIQKLLLAYHGIMMWFRFIDDRVDYAGNAICGAVGTPEFSEVLAPLKTRGVQLNRDDHEAKSYLRVGERQASEKNQQDESNLLTSLGATLSPRKIRAISCWLWLDRDVSSTTIFEAHNQDKAIHNKDRIALGIEGESYYFEIWDEEQRIMRLNAPMGTVAIGEWQHIAVSTTDDSAWWPTWQMFINGVLVATKKDGRLSPAMEIKEASIGRGVRGCLADFRMYSAPLDPLATMQWCRDRLYSTP